MTADIQMHLRSSLAYFSQFVALDAGKFLLDLELFTMFPGIATVRPHVPRQNRQYLVRLVHKFRLNLGPETSYHS